MHFFLDWKSIYSHGRKPPGSCSDKSRSRSRTTPDRLSFLLLRSKLCWEWWRTLLPPKTKWLKWKSKLTLPFLVFTLFLLWGLTVDQELKFSIQVKMQRQLFTLTPEGAINIRPTVDIQSAKVHLWRHVDAAKALKSFFENRLDGGNGAFPIRNLTPIFACCLFFRIIVSMLNRIAIRLAFFASTKNWFSKMLLTFTFQFKTIDF